MIHKIYGYQRMITKWKYGNKHHICICDNLLFVITSSTHPPEGKKQVIECNNSKMLFGKRNFHLLKI